MISDLDYVNNPWNVAMTVKASRFAPLVREHARFNVEVDLGAMPAFGGVEREIDPATVLLSDLQTPVASFAAGRLGSGRSGFFGGRYVKGVGRTVLAQNWRSLGDRLHGSGEIAASAAVREFLVSCYFRAKGRADLLNVCEGLLLAPLAEGLRTPSARGFGENEPLPCDQRMHGLTVKGSRFARFMNFSWLVRHLDVQRSPHDLRRFFRLLVSYLEPDSDVDEANVTPSRVARALAGAIERGFDTARAIEELGVVFPSPYNNFTIDGRYHDLDNPVFVGAGYLGALLPGGDGDGRKCVVPRYDPHHVFGLSSVALLHQTRLYVRDLLGALETLLRFEVRYARAERTFVRQVRVEIDEALRASVLFSKEAFVARTMRGFRERLDLPPRVSTRLRRLVGVAYDARVAAAPRTEEVTLDLVDVPLRLARPGLVDQGARHPLAWSLTPPSAEGLEEAGFMNGLLMRLDEITDRDALLDACGRAEKDIVRYCARPCAPRAKRTARRHCPARPWW